LTINVKITLERENFRYSVTAYSGAATDAAVVTRIGSRCQRVWDETLGINPPHGALQHEIMNVALEKQQPHIYNYRSFDHQHCKMNQLIETQADARISDIIKSNRVRKRMCFA
jgi:hypothetical protein